MPVNKLTLLATLLCGATFSLSPATAQESSRQPVEDSTPWNPEQVPAQTVFDYGAAAEPVLVCAPGKYCGLALETGETVLSAEANEDHWSVTPTVYGAGKLAKPVILISPIDPGVTDELDITSISAGQKGRGYKVKLVSTADKWTQLATFRYQPGQ
jgi:type IV secretory pathway VirB9-like protein